MCEFYLNNMLFTVNATFGAVCWCWSDGFVFFTFSI